MKLFSRPGEEREHKQWGMCERENVLQGRKWEQWQQEAGVKTTEGGFSQPLLSSVFSSFASVLSSSPLAPLLTSSSASLYTHNHHTMLSPEVWGWRKYECVIVPRVWTCWGIQRFFLCVRTQNKHQLILAVFITPMWRQNKCTSWYIHAQSDYKASTSGELDRLYMMKLACN